ncbi:MAG: sulfite exporter TauE/SafE family protein [Ignavibacteriaceae bacterium]|nr:sulfite exporter TauE/SafE family protein [Ignavibacteriaceae bacterium]
MSELAASLIFLVSGFFSGILIGMLGIGGGLVFVPLLYFTLPLLGIQESSLAYYTIGTSLFTGAIAVSNSAILHIKAKNFLKKPAIFISLGSLITASITPFFVVEVESKTLEIIFASVLFIVLISILFESNGRKWLVVSNPLSEKYYIPLGLFAGIFSAFIGLGGGVIYLPALMNLFLVEPRKAVGTSSIIAAVTMLTATISYLFQSANSSLPTGAWGFIVLAAAIPLGIGAILGSFVGVRLALLSSNLVIKKVFAGILLIAIIRIFFNIG